jgi:hypothetical protein
MKNKETEKMANKRPLFGIEISPWGAYLYLYNNGLR